MKCFSVLMILTVTVFLVQGEEDHRYDLLVGARQKHDYLLHQEIVEISYSILRSVKKQIDFVGSENKIISAIEFINLKPELKDDSAKPIIMAGGIGEDFVRVNFKSKRGHGIHYLFKVYTTGLKRLA